MISDADITAMTDTITASLPEPLTILRESAGTVDGWGHKARTFPTEHLVQGFVHQLVGNEEQGPLIAGAVVATGEVRLPAGTQINERDKIRRANGELLETVYVHDPSGYGLLIEVGVFAAKAVVAGA